MFVINQIRPNFSVRCEGYLRRKYVGVFAQQVVCKSWSSNWRTWRWDAISAANVSIRGNRTRPTPFDPNLRSEMEMVLCFNLHHLLFCTAVGVVRFKVGFSGITYPGIPFSLNYYLFIIDGILLSFSLSACQTTHVWDIRACRIHYDSSQNNSPSNPFL